MMEMFTISYVKCISILLHLLHTYRACLTRDGPAVYVCVKPQQDNRGLDYLLMHHLQA